MPVSAPRPLLSGRKGTKLHRGGSDWTLGSISVLGGWAGTGTGFLERYLVAPCLSAPKRRLDNALVCVSVQLALTW